MKKKRILLTILLTALTLLLAFPVQANAKTTDVSKVLNKKISSAASALGFRRDYHMDTKSSVNFENGSVKSIRMIYAPKGKYSSSKSYLWGESYYKNKAGKWYAELKDKSISLYGAKVGMTPAQAYQKFTKHGWKRVFNGAYNNMYLRNNAVIYVSLKGSKIKSMTYSWILESEY